MVLNTSRDGFTRDEDRITAHALNLGDDGEDRQPDELQRRENVIAVAATQSSILSTVWSWEAAKSRWSIRMQPQRVAPSFIINTNGFMLDVPYSMVSVICNLAYVINSDLLIIKLIIRS